MLSLRNRELILAAIANAKYFGCPWVLGADFQIPPDDLQAQFGTVLEQADAYIVATSQPTFRPGGKTHSTIDYFIVSASAKELIQDVCVEPGYEAAPHVAVRLTLRTSIQQRLVEVMRRPKAFPRHKPIGCPRSPVIPRWASPAADDQDKYVAASGPLVSDTSRQEGSQADTWAAPEQASTTIPLEDHDPRLVEERWPSLCTAIESEIGRVCDLVGADGTTDPKYRGHGKEVTVVKRMILPMRSSASLGKLPIRAHALVWIHNRVAELACISQKYHQGRRITAATAKQWEQIMKRLSSRKGLVEVVRKISTQWSDNVDAIAAHTLGSGTNALKGIAAVALYDAASWKEHAQAKAAAAWTAFIQHQVKIGAGISHRLVKRDELPIFDYATVGSGQNRSASPDDVLVQDFAQWRAVWTRLGDSPTAPWRNQLVTQDSDPITAADITAAASSFKHSTAIGVDSFPPRAIG